MPEERVERLFSAAFAYKKISHLNKTCAGLKGGSIRPPASAICEPRLRLPTQPQQGLLQLGMPLQQSQVICFDRRDLRADNLHDGLLLNLGPAWKIGNQR